MIIIDQSRTTKLTEQDRLQLAQLLVKAGYTVRIDRKKEGTSSVPYIHFEERKSVTTPEMNEGKE